MNTVTEEQHDEIAELLPDFAIGVLGDGDFWRVEAHLETCSRCQAEFALILEVASVIAPVSPPSAAAKRALFERAGLSLPERDSAKDVHPLRIVGDEPPHQVARIRLFPARLARIALPAAALILILLGGWNVWLQRELDDQEDLVALFVETGNAHPLTDSEVPTDATAVFYVDPQRDRALLTAQNLPPLIDDQRYQVWLFTEDGQRVSGGSFVPEDDGSVVATVESPETIATYWAVGISVEPGGSSEAPTTPLILGGWIR